MKSIIHTAKGRGLIQFVLIPLMAIPLPSLAQQPPRANDGRVRANRDFERRARLDRQRLYTEIMRNRELMRLLLKQQSRLLLDKETRKKLDEQQSNRIDDAYKRLTSQSPRIQTEASKAFRKKLQDIAKGIKENPIDATTSEETVQNVIGRIKHAQTAIIAERGKRLKEYQDKVNSLGTTARQFVKSPVGDVFEKLKKDELVAALQKLNPELSLNDIKQKSEAELRKQMKAFSQGGSWSPELLAAIGKDGLNKLIPEGVLKPDDKLKLGTVVEAAKTLTDVHRSGAEFASFSINVMEAAIATGNPYVIAAAALLVLLIFLFKFVFGGGGGGDGDGDGEGKGKGTGKGNTGAGDSNRQPDVPGPPKTTPIASDFRLPDQGGDYILAIQAGVLKVFRRSDRKPVFESKLADVVDAGTSRKTGWKGQQLKKVTDITLKPAAGYAVELKSGPRYTVTQTGNGWTAYEGKPLPVDPKQKSSEYRVTRTPTSLLIFKGNKKLHSIPYKDVFAIQKGKKVKIGLKPDWITQVRSYSERDKMLVIDYKFQGKTPTKNTRLLNDEGSWILRPPI